MPFFEKIDINKKYELSEVVVFKKKIKLHLLALFIIVIICIIFSEYKYLFSVCIGLVVANIVMILELNRRCKMK